MAATAPAKSRGGVVEVDSRDRDGGGRFWRSGGAGVAASEVAVAALVRSEGQDGNNISHDGSSLGEGGTVDVDDMVAGSCNDVVCNLELQSDLADYRFKVTQQKRAREEAEARLESTQKTLDHVKAATRVLPNRWYLLSTIEGRYVLSRLSSRQSPWRYWICPFPFPKNLSPSFSVGLCSVCSTPGARYKRTRDGIVDERVMQHHVGSTLRWVPKSSPPFGHKIVRLTWNLHARFSFLVGPAVCKAFDMPTRGFFSSDTPLQRFRHAHPLIPYLTRSAHRAHTRATQAYYFFRK